jgi:hypothetical protein
VPVRMARVPEEESRKWCGHSYWPMYHDVNNNNINIANVGGGIQHFPEYLGRWRVHGINSCVDGWALLQ